MLSRPLIGLIRAYQWIFRPVMGMNCRFVPSCSDYALEAIRRHGPFRGTILAAWRILRCNPWNIGGYDPVPERGPARGPCCSSHR
ncbi:MULTISPECIES: membrane protein insertion efficiency factor YidD [Nguyenibacter]|uniref:membrane protein insertion efficiency factor YidD n=1 Tax=Nguyenibacter TaxID=1519186 RepID=UPI0038D11B8A